MKRISYILFLLLFFGLQSCKKSREEFVIEPEEPQKPIVDFGFKYDDFNVEYDTIGRQDTFERILKKQNLNGKKASEIIKIVKDSFSTNVNYRRPYIALRSKDKFNKLQYLIYQPDRLNYYLVDLTSSIKGYKKSRPLSFKIKTIAGELSGSLATTLKNQKIDASLTKKLMKLLL